MKVILLAGGFGTRLAEYTDVIPKPMVPIGGKPILWHIMQTYAHYGHKDFYIALGYKAEVIKEYFYNYHALNSDFTVNLADGHVEPHQPDPIDWKVTLVNTGETSMTGGRVKRLQSLIGNETCMLTYGDGVADIDGVYADVWYPENVYLGEHHEWSRQGCGDMHGNEFALSKLNQQVTRKQSKKHALAYKNC